MVPTIPRLHYVAINQSPSPTWWLKNARWNPVAMAIAITRHISTTTCARHAQHMFILSPWWCLHGDVSMVMSPWWFLSHGDVSMVTLSPWWCNHALSLSLGSQHKICRLGNWLNSLINQKFSQFLILHFKFNIKNKAKRMIWFLLVSSFTCAPQEKIWKKLEWHGKEIQAPWC